MLLHVFRIDVKLKLTTI